MLDKSEREMKYPYCVKNDIYAQCHKRSRLIRKGNYKATTIDPFFKKGLEEFGIFMETEPTEYTHERILKVIIKEEN